MVSNTQSVAIKTAIEFLINNGQNFKKIKLDDDSKKEFIQTLHDQIAEYMKNLKENKQSKNNNPDKIQCCYTFSSGDKKGEQCQTIPRAAVIIDDEIYCSKHGKILVNKASKKASKGEKLVCAGENCKSVPRGKNTEPDVDGNVWCSKHKPKEESASAKKKSSKHPKCANSECNVHPTKPLDFEGSDYCGKCWKKLSTQKAREASKESHSESYKSPDVSESN